MPKSVIIPITNVFAKGGYTAKIKVGSEGATANLILDSGSSALVIQGEDYDPANDQHLEPTSLVQSRTYGIGGWFGPIVKTKVKMGYGAFSVELDGLNVAVTRKEQQNSFIQADGIMGLAYYELNKAYDITDYLVENNIEPTKSYPWFMAEEQQDDTVREFKSFLKQYPKSYLTPYFTQLEQEGVVGNQFGFFIHRSSIYQPSPNASFDQLRLHPLNNGFFVMGKPKLHEHLFKGKFLPVKVLDDKYYNVNVQSLQVGDCPPITAPQLDEKDLNHISNGIVDSGASVMVLPPVMFEQMYVDLVSINPKFESILEPYLTFEGVEEGVDLSLINLSEWPSIYFVLDGLEGEAVTLELKPHDYWQIHAPLHNQASFQFIMLEGWPNQCILGLPLMASYFTIFDRSQSDKGVILFADKP